MSTLKANNVQIGTSATATQNFTLRSNADGTATLARGNVGETSQDILTIDASGNTAVVGAINVGSGKLVTDASGNLGLGVTPSAWSGGGNFNLSGDILGGSAVTLGTNWYFNGGFKYKATGTASRFYLDSTGGYAWYTAPSGTAGNPITFTQAMTLDASGNFMVGATSTAAKFRVSGASANTYMLIDNVGSGENYYHANTAQIFGTAGAERMRLDASGNLLVGCTSSTPSTGGIVLNPGNGQNSVFVIDHASGAASGNFYASFAYTDSSIGSITQSGTTAVAYNTTSDHRLKENVRPADAARFMDIEFVDFEWVDGRHDCGVIAHQLQSVYPDLVLGEKDATEVRTVEITPAVPAVSDKRLMEMPADLTEEEIAVFKAVDSNYEWIEVTPAVPAITEEQTFPVYQQVNYIGLIGRMGTRVQQLQRTMDAQAALIAAMEARLSTLEAA